LRPDSEKELVPTDIRYDGAMSELGQTRKCWRFHIISALPRKADINCRNRGIRFVPTTEVQVGLLAICFLASG
jgi:hypothetical protein